MLTEHEFRDEDILFPKSGPTLNHYRVNYRMICRHCGCYRIHETDVWDDNAGPYVYIPLHKGPEGRMHQLWIDKPEL